MNDVTNQLGLPIDPEAASLLLGLVETDKDFSRHNLGAASFGVIEGDDVGWTLVLKKRFVQVRHGRRVEYVDS